MDTVNHLLEGASPYQVLSEQSAKLASKWERSGLLEGIETSTEKNNMAMLLENQAKQLVNEASSTGTATSITTGNSEAWAGVALPLVRRVFGEIVAKDLVSVQPMNLPSGLIFYLDFQYGTDQNFKSADESLYGAAGSTSTLIKRTDGGFDKGLYGTGEFAYSITQSTVTATSVTSASAVFLEILNADTEFSSSEAAKGHTFGGTNGVDDEIFTIQIPLTDLSGSDNDAVRAWNVTDSGLTVIPQFTRINGTNVEFVVSGAANQAFSGTTVTYLQTPDNLDDRGDFEDTIPAAGVSSQAIPEINVKLISDTVAAKTRKLKAQWTPEFAQDLNAYHSIDAEAELTSILSEYISMEIDLEILDMLIRSADTIEGWSAKVAQDITVSSNNTAGGATAVTLTSNQNNLGVYYTKMSWFQFLQS